MWEPGTKLFHKHNPELGVGVVVNVEGRFLDVFFPDAMSRMRLTPDPKSIQPVVFKPGDVVKGPDGIIDAIIEIDGAYAVLMEGDRVEIEQLWPVLSTPSLLERLRDGSLDLHEHVLNRIDGIRLLDFRRQGEMPSLVGGRVELFPHQLDTASRAIKQDRVRWLLADEVGLGKTIVAHMITSAMIRMGKISSVVVIAPDTLTVQWLGELYRKFSQVFVHIDMERLEDVRTDFGKDTNPFDVYPLSVVSMELLREDPFTLSALATASPEMVIVDEAHELLHPQLAPEIFPLVERVEHALFLTATPFQLGAEGFLKLVEVLGLEHLEADGGRHIVKNVSHVTREDIPALPVREPEAIEIEAPGKLDLSDERVDWLLQHLQQWKDEGKKALLFVEDAKRAKKLHDTLTHSAHMELFMFHEDMRTKERDIELSRFRLSASPALISSGAGSEGRNFQFCDVLVHVDLPEDPTVLEQRIGRLDRIGREGNIPIVYFKQEDGSQGYEIAACYEKLGIFKDASVGSSPAMSILRAYLTDPDHDPSKHEEVVEEVEEAMNVHGSSWLFPNSHDPDVADEVLEQLPDELDMLTERFCVDAAERVELSCVEHDGFSVYFFEYGAETIVENIPGLPDDTGYLGTFDREEAVLDTELDFFSNGHPLVEGLLAELEDSDQGRVGCAQLSRARVPGTDLAKLTYGTYLLVITGRESVTDAHLFAIEDHAKLLEVNGKELLEVMEWSKPMPKQTKKDCRRTLKECQGLDPVMDLDVVALMLIDLTR